MPALDCDSPCAGDFSEACGAESLLQVYHNNADSVVSPYMPTSSVIPGTINDSPSYGVTTFVYQGCYPYGFDGVINYDRNVTAEGCAEFCEGYPNMSLRYGNHCYCGTMNYCGENEYCDTQCEAPCVGNSSEACGADYFSLVYDAVPAPS